MPHPLEELRYVARNWGSGDDLPAAEVAAVLAGLAEDSPSMLLQACRRVIEYFPGSGPAWWLSARILTAADPADAAWQAAEDLGQDPTPAVLARVLPPGITLAAPQAARAVAEALRRRAGDVEVAKKASAGRVSLVLVSAVAAGPAGAAAVAAGPAGVAAPAGVLVATRAAAMARLASSAGKDVWAVVPRGTLLPGPLWEQLLARRADDGALEVLDPDAFSSAVGEKGRASLAAVLSGPTCPAVAELLGWVI